MLVAAYFIFAAMMLALRYWILPNIGGYAAAIERSVSKALGERVTIGAIHAGWSGLHPELRLANVTVYDAGGRAALSLPGVDAALSWTSLLYGSLHFHSLAFDRPKLEIRRDKAGRFYIAGIELHPERKGDTGIAEWVLSQREIIIRGANVTWDDNLRAAPRLSLSGLDFVLRNGLRAHRFAFKAKPPVRLASALDLRGELYGSNLADPEGWSGRLYAELEYTDLTAWRPWVDYPLEVRSGKGGVRLWLGFAGKIPTEAVADVALSQVVARLGRELPLLELDYLQGRLGARQGRRGNFEVFGRKIAMKTGAGVALPPADFGVRWETVEGGKKGEMDANALELAPLAKLAEYLPFPMQVRARLAATEPRGSIYDLKLTWTGEADNPQHYGARARFAGLGARAHEGIPGFAGLSGRVEADEKSGSLQLASDNAGIELPGIVAESRVQFDSLTGRIGWKKAPDHLELDFDNLSLANGEIAGTLFGSFATRADSHGVIDLTGNFSRAEAAAVYRYIPFLPARAADYLKASILGGQSNEIQLRLKGNLRDFPFDDASTGAFQVMAKVQGATFRYAENWPQATGISGEIALEGRGMRVAASGAGLLGVRAGKVIAVVPDLFRGNEQLHLEVSADSQTAEVLKLVNGSPLGAFVESITEDVHAVGEGRLALKLDLPVRQPDQAKFSGGYEFRNNQVRIGGEVPPFTQVNGRLEFSENGLSARSIGAQFLGGPMTFSLLTRRDGSVAAGAQGTANLAQLPRAWGGSLTRRISGVTGWSATLAGGRGRPLTLAINSQLAGVTIDLPAPLGKSAGESLPLHFERTVEADAERAGQRRGDVLKASLGRSIGVIIRRRQEGAQLVIERGVVSFSEPPVLPERVGIAVTGSLPYLDLDRWRTLLSGEDMGGIGPSSLVLKVAALDFAGRRLNDFSVRAGTSGEVWVANVTAKELAGEIAWRPEGLGRIVARLKQLTVPEAAPGGVDNGTPARNMPSLDIVADVFILRDKNLGKLELTAINETRDWRIEKLVLSSPEWTLTADGVWQSWAPQPSISANVKVESSDVGKYFERIGYSNTMQRGTAKLEGRLSWLGSPHVIDYPSLAGNLTLRASRGQFLKLDPGVGKLLGVLSLQSWITLDLPGLFGDGFAFESLSSTATIAKGMLTTKDFQMRGPSAQVSMTGEIDLAKETQDLRVRVVPSLSGGVSSILSLLRLNPIIGLGSVLLQNILKDPVGQIFAWEYAVTGTWSDPKAEQIKPEGRAASAGAPKAPQ